MQISPRYSRSWAWYFSHEVGIWFEKDPLSDVGCCSKRFQRVIRNNSYDMFPHGYTHKYIYIYGMYLVCFFWMCFFRFVSSLLCDFENRLLRFRFYLGGGQFLLSCLAVVERGPPSKEIAGLIKGLWSPSLTLDNPLIRLIRHCSHEFHWMMPAIYHSCNWGSFQSWREEIQINMFVSSLKEFRLKGCSFHNRGAPQTHQNTIQRLAERKSLGTD